MADQFEAELQNLVGKVARELAHDITRLILRRLGIEGAPRTGPAKGQRVSAGAVSKALRQAAKGRVKRSSSGGSRPRGRTTPARARTTSDERAAILEKVAGVVDGADGLSVGEIERESGLSRAAVASALKQLKEQGRAFMGGTKRFARYASTQAVADKASVDARGGAAA